MQDLWVGFSEKFEQAREGQEMIVFFRGKCSEPVNVDPFRCSFRGGEMTGGVGCDHGDGLE